MLISKEPIRQKLLGSALQIALGRGGTITILTRDDRQEHWLQGVDVEGNKFFSNHLSSGSHSLRLGNDGATWVGIPSGLQQYDQEGKLMQTHHLPRRGNEELGSFLLLEDGIIAALQNRTSRKPGARILRLNAQGETLWATSIMPDALSYTGIVQMSPASNWQPRPKPPWRPRTWVSYYHQPLLLNGDTLLVHFHEHPASGIGIIYAFDVTSGTVRWTTEPRPYDIKIIAGPDSFLIGAQGYGAFDTWQYNLNGDILNHWPSHGYYLINEDKEIRLVEMENITPSRMHFVILKPDSQVVKGPHLPGYYTSYPVIDRQGNAIFWRHGELTLIDEALNLNVLASEKNFPPYAFPTRMLLHDDGNLVFALEDQLRIYPTTLSPLAKSPWPCDEGSLFRNPVL